MTSVAEEFDQEVAQVAVVPTGERGVVALKRGATNCLPAGCTRP
jgi:hypothetical protein